MTSKINDGVAVDPDWLEEDVEYFVGSGLRISGRIYRKRDGGTGLSPGVVICQGFGGPKTGTPVGIARLLAGKSGIVVLTADYRGFGDSDGPKGRLVPSEQAEDMVAAIEYLADRRDVDGDRIAVYGNSFGGGIAVQVLERSRRARCGAVVVPVTSGFRWLKSRMTHERFTEVVLLAEAALREKTHTGKMAMVNRDVIMPPDAITAARYADASEMSLETFLHVLAHEPLDAAQRLSKPMLVIGVQPDELVPVQQAIDLHDALRGPKRLHLFETGHHYSPYDELLGDVFDLVNAWFNEHL